jgi:hypothetical protein
VHENKKLHAVFAGLVRLILLVMGLSLVIHFTWNLTAPDVFGAAKLEFQSAVGLAGLALIVKWVLTHGFNRRRADGSGHATCGR